MAPKPIYSIIHVILIVAFLTIQVVLSDDTVPIPADKGQLGSWFTTNVGPLDSRKSALDPALVTAEAGSKVVKVMSDGSGEFKTITEAINSVPSGNTNRVIIYIGPGNYNEKIKIERTKPFITFYGLPEKMPNLTFGGTAKEYGTVDSATLIVEADYFVAANIIISNTAPRPDGKTEGAQAVSLRISGDKATFYNVKILGFQDTNTELDTLSDNGVSVITAQARKGENEDNGYSFVHCTVSGTGTNVLLGRAWMSHPKVIFAYSTLTNTVSKEAWSNNNHPEFDKSAYFGEYKNTGPAADPNGRAPITKQLSEADVKLYLTLGFIEGSKWLLPPPSPKV